MTVRTRAKHVMNCLRNIRSVALEFIVFFILAGGWIIPVHAQDDMDEIFRKLEIIKEDIDKISGFLDKRGKLTGGPVSGSLFFQPPAEEFASNPPVLLPDIEVFLHNKATGVDSPPVVTDLYGRYRFPHQAPGNYTLHWNAQRGWGASNHPDPVVITNGPRFPTPARLFAERGTGVIFGTVELGDGGTPWSYDEMFRVNHSATVTVLNVTRTQTLAGPIHANSLGGYAAAGLPRSQPTTIMVRSEAASLTRALAPTAVSVGNAVNPTNLQLANVPPEIIALTPLAGGTLARAAEPGDKITLAASTRDLNGDPLSHEWVVPDAHGSINPSGGSTADWTLPIQAGTFSAYLQVGDGRGGFARRRIDFTTGEKEKTFSGVVVEKGTGAPIKNAAVTGNGVTALSDANGFFSLRTAISNRYVLSIEREGFALFSRVIDTALTGQTWPLVRAQSETVDPKADIDLVDTRPELDRKKMRGTRIVIPANSLVNADGKPPEGMLTANIATLDIRDGEGPGDWGAKMGGGETNLISYGATFVEFRDAAGVKFNLAEGTEAKIETFAPPGFGGALPAKPKLWSYDEADGFWKESGLAFAAGGGKFEGAVKHFSTINTDVEKDDDSCLKILIYPPIPTGVKLRVTDPSSAVFPQAFEGVLDAGINAVFRLPSNTNVQLELKNADNSPYGGALLLEEVPGLPLASNIVNTGPPIGPGLTPFPDEPYETCKLVILREANAPTANAFLAFKGAGDLATADGYYQAVDPNDLRETLGEWWTTNGFTVDATGAATNATAVRTSYLNFNDLGSGRDMYFLQRPDGTVSAYVTNFGLFNQDHANADLAASRTSPGATVAMEYGPVEGQGPTRVVKFFVFAGADFGANAPRAASADLDGFGAKFVPNLCLNCHGGSYFPGNPASPSFADINMGAVFRELDIATYKFPGGQLTANNVEKANFKAQNLIVKGLNPGDTITNQPIRDVINGWYPGASVDQDNTFTPTGWLGNPQQGLYHDVVKESCRTCHIGLDPSAAASGISWSTYDQLAGRHGSLQLYALCTGRFMPHAVITYRNFWLSAGPHRPAVLRDYADGATWPALGPCQ
jgi:hypothetical protein